MLRQSTQQSSFLNNFLTPQHTQRPIRPQSLNKSNNYKRIPIFSTSRKSQTHNLLLSSTYKNNSKYNSKSYQQPHQQLGFSNVINYDFCGCQNRLTPCDIIANTFLANISMNQMKNSYFQDLQRLQRIQHHMDINYKKSLLQKLPKTYPQAFYSQLNNLMEVIGLQKVGPSQFQCLSAIQYHCKIQYLTYFLYNDIKKMYSSKQKFYLEAEKQLQLLNTTFRQIRFIYNQQSLTETLQKFINQYYNSLGANLIPIPYYAKFIAQVYKKGSKYFVKMLVSFIVKNKQEMKRGLKFLRINQVQLYRNYMRQLNFQEFINQMV